MEADVVDWIKYDLEGKTRDKPISPELQSALSFLPDMGVEMVVFSGGQPAKGSGGARVGSVRHDHGDAADVFFYKDGKKLDWSKAEDRPIFEEIVKKGKANGLTGFGAGPGYMAQGSMHVGFGTPAVWGAGGKGANAPDWLRAAYGMAPAGGSQPQRAAASGAVSGGGGSDVMVGQAASDDLGNAPMSDVFDMFNQLQQQAPPAEPSPMDILDSGPDMRDVFSQFRQMTSQPEVAGTGVLQPRITDPGAVPEAQQIGGGAGMDITARTTDPYRNLLRATAASVSGEGPSITGQILPDYMQGIGRVADAALVAPLGAAGLGYSAAVGAGADALQAMGMSSAPRLARDLMAAPDALAGSPGAVLAGPTQMAGRAATRAAPPARVEPPVTNQPPMRAQIAGAAQDAAPRPSAVPEPFKNRADLGRALYSAASGNKKEKDRISRMIDVDPEVAAAADRVGLAFPADVLGRNFQIQEVTQAMRVATGTDMAEEWRTTVTNAADRAAEILKGQGAAPTSEAVEQVRADLSRSIITLEGAGRELYDRAGQKIPSGAQISPSNSIKALNDFLRTRTANISLKGANKQLFDLVTNEGGLTYDDLRDFKTSLGKYYEERGPYMDADSAMVNAVYAAVSKDLEAFADAAGPGVANMVKKANKLWSEKSELQKNMIEAFGKNGEKAFAPLLTRAITAGGKGDAGQLAKLVRLVPESLRRETVLSGLNDVVSRGGAGQFSFPAFAGTWGGIISQPPVAAMMRKELGADTFNVLNDLYKVSEKVKPMVQGVAQKRMTGASMTADQVVREAFVDNMLTRFLDSSAGAPAKSAVGAAIGGVGGPVGAAVGAAGATSLKIGGRRARVASELFKDPMFNRMATEAARRGEVSERTQRAVAQSPKFKAWANAVGIVDPQTWLSGVVASGAIAQQETE